MDGTITKAPPGKRYKRKSHHQTELNLVPSEVQMVVDGKGLPLGITVDADNRHDMKMTKTTLQSIVIHRPEPRASRVKQHMCMDKGYDYLKVYELLEDQVIHSYPFKTRTQSKLHSIFAKEYPNTGLDIGLLEEPTPR